MSTSVAITPSSSPSSLWDHAYGFCQRASEQCATTFKVHALYLSGRLLQAAAVASLAFSTVAFFVSAPIGVLGIITTIALGVWGTHLAEQGNQGVLEPPRPRLPGEPIGFRNDGNDCWLNAGLQLLAHAPALEKRIRAIPIIEQFLDAHRGPTPEPQKISSHRIREYLNREAGVPIDPGVAQEDAAVLFETLFEGSNALYEFELVKGGEPSSTSRREPMIQFDLDKGETAPSFKTLFDRFFSYSDDLGQTVELFFRDQPNELLIQLKRFFQLRDGERGKIDTSIEVPETVELPPERIHAGKKASYVIDGFLVHEGKTSSSGHYVSYIKGGGRWWRCSDSMVKQVTEPQMKDALKTSYILHFSKV